MAWIESHQSLKDHRKTIRLSKVLHINKAQAIGHLHCLWWWCLDNAADGNLSDIWPEELAEGALWTKDANDFLNALIDSKFIDREENKLIIHDWYEFAGKLVDKRSANKQRMRKARSDKFTLKIDDCATHVQCTCGARATNVDGTCNACAGATVPNSTVPNSTVPNSTKDPPNPQGEGIISFFTIAYRDKTRSPHAPQMTASQRRELREMGERIGIERSKQAVNAFFNTPDEKVIEAGYPVFLLISNPVERWINADGTPRKSTNEHNRNGNGNTGGRGARGMPQASLDAIEKLIG